LRIRTARAGTVLIWILILHTASASSAAAGSKDPFHLGRMFRPPARLIRQMPDIAGLHLRPPSRGDERERYRYVNVSLPIAGDSPYERLWIDASKGRHGSYLAFATYRFDEVSDSDQFHVWQFRVPRDAVEIANDLSRVSIHSGTNLGSLGSIDLDLTSTGRSHGEHHRCRATGERLDTVVGRRLRVSGEVALSLGIATVPEPLTSEGARGWGARITYTGARCPHERRCYPSGGFSAYDDSTDTWLSATRLGWIDVIREEATWRTWMVSWLSRYGYDGADVAITHDSVTIDGGAATPFLSGVIAFERSGPPERGSSGPCVRISVPRAWTSGTLDILWDTTPGSLTGPDLEAATTRYRRKP